ncbi:TetR/AcrR family transcriptional regulator [Jannaschia sp. R86511]|uniref:TetR/AcrR family transcriptional regulator n=1 Tax=Jannaschia sp. R86511 TaxID=3093853 RepID=UPI0036D426FD
MPRAGLTPAVVTVAGAELVDEVGVAGLSMGLLAERLGVRPPSLYKHVDGLADLTHRVAVLGMTEVGDAIGAAIQGCSGYDALAAAAQALRAYVKDHPGRYAVGNDARAGGPDDPLAAAAARLLGVLTAVLRGYRLDPGQEVHALRLLRSAVHGFATIEAAGGFRLETDVDESFRWLVDRVDAGLRAAGAPESSPGPDAR